MPSPTEHPPCPDCGAPTVECGEAPHKWLETMHERDCAWMADPEAEPYDDFGEFWKELPPDPNTNQ